MRTFSGHASKHALHGITVVVETHGPELYVGRCDDIDDRGVHLKDADCHHEAESPLPRAEFLARARQVGVWPNHRQLTVPAGAVARIARLAEPEERKA